MAIKDGDGGVAAAFLASPPTFSSHIKCHFEITSGAGVSSKQHTSQGQLGYQDLSTELQPHPV